MIGVGKEFMKTHGFAKGDKVGAMERGGRKKYSKREHHDFGDIVGKIFGAAGPSDFGNLVGNVMNTVGPLLPFLALKDGGSAKKSTLHRRRKK